MTGRTGNRTTSANASSAAQGDDWLTTVASAAAKDGHAPAELLGQTGSYIPFPQTNAVRIERGDPRSSIEERYKTEADYLDKIRGAANALRRDGFLLEADTPKIVALAKDQWDWAIQGPEARPPDARSSASRKVDGNRRAVSNRL